MILYRKTKCADLHCSDRSSPIYDNFLLKPGRSTALNKLIISDVHVYNLLAVLNTYFALL